LFNITKRKIQEINIIITNKHNKLITPAASAILSP